MDEKTRRLINPEPGWLDRASEGGIGLSLLAASLLFLGATSVFGYGLWSWLRHGEWAPVSVADALALIDLEPQATGWAGIDRLLGGYFESSVGWTLLFASLVITFAAAVWSDDWDRRLQKERQTTQ